MGLLGTGKVLVGRFLRGFVDPPGFFEILIVSVAFIVVDVVAAAAGRCDAWPRAAT